MKHLIDPSPSQFGTSFHQNLLKCPQLAAYKYLLGLDMEPSEGMQRGSLIHVGIAHHYVTEAIKAGGKVIGATDLAEGVTFSKLEDIYDPLTAIQIAAQNRGSQEFIELATNAVLGYQLEYARDDVTALATEHVLQADIEGYTYGQRVDLIAEDRVGRIWLIDHKSGYKPDGKGAIESFALDLQFLGYHLLGRAHYGNRFGGVLINCISTGQGKFSYSRHKPGFAPWALNQLPREIVRVRKEWDQLQADGTDPYLYPKRLHANVCFDKYGPCQAYEYCKMGPEILPVRGTT